MELYRQPQAHIIVCLGQEQLLFVLDATRSEKQEHVAKENDYES